MTMKLSALLAGAAILGSRAAMAQEKATGLDEILVTELRTTSTFG
jgi:hypothetical protein